jgi:WD40 repeat protein
LDKENQDLQNLQEPELDEFENTSAPFIYAAQFNKKQDVVLAGGAGTNQVRCYDYETGNILSVISDLPRACLHICNANNSNDFAFGSADSRMRIFQMKTVQVEFTIQRAENVHLP